MSLLTMNFDQLNDLGEKNKAKGTGNKSCRFILFMCEIGNWGWV